MNTAVADIIVSIPSWIGADISVKPMRGLTNKNYLVTVNEERFVIRVAGANRHLHGMNVDSEREALTIAQNAGVGPEVLRFFLPEGHLVTRLINGNHWTVEEFRNPTNIRRLVETVKRLHSLKAAKATFSSFRRVELYTANAEKLKAPFPEDFHVFLSKMQAIEDQQGRDRTPWLGFCHNDLFAVNFLDDGNIRVVDWEFAGMGDIYFDLATLVYAHDEDGPLNPDLETYLLQCYFGNVNHAQRTRLDGMEYMVLFLTAMWGLVQHGAQENGLIPAREDFDYLAYAQQTFATVRQNWL